MLYSSNKENLTYRDKRITANFYICTNEIPGENQIPNIKIIKQMLPVPNVLLDCVTFFIILTDLELFVTFSKINNKLVKF
jgi:hypothetical protein